MLIRLGRMLNAGGHNTTYDDALTDTFSLLGPSLPTGFTYARSDSVATYRNSSGAMVQAAANEVRFDHTAAGVALGVLMEESRTNKCTAYNLNPTDMTGLTKGGNVTATATIVSDSAKLAERGYNFGNGNVLEINNTLGGSGTAYVDVDGTYANTNLHSLSCVVYVVAGSNCYIADSGGANVVTSTDNAGYARIVSENITPGSTTRKLRLAAPIGCRGRFILFQMEEGATATSPIIVAGASATRALAALRCTTLSSIPAWNQAQGALVVEFTPTNDGRDTIAADQYAVIACNGTGLTDGWASYAISPRFKGRARAMAASTNYATTDMHTGLIKGKINPLGITWVNGGAVKAFAGAGVFTDFTMSAAASGVNRINLGGREFSNAINGHIRSLRVYNRSRTLSQMLAGVISSNDKALSFSGQSNAGGYFHQQSANTNGGERAMQTYLDTIWNGGTRNWLINGATNGTSIADWTAPAGTAIARWKEITGAFMDNGGQIPAIIWDQGEANVGDSVATLKAGWLAIFNDMRSYLASKGGTGNEPVIIIPAGRRADADQDFRTFRLAQRELASETAWIHLAPEKWHQTLDADGIHLADAGYAAQGPHVVRKALKVIGETITGGVDGPSITGAVRTGTSVAVTIAHDAGTDFTPTSGIQGFKFFGNGSEIAITAAVRTNATTITLTLASTPTGTEELYYGYRSLYGVTAANLVLDNEATYPKPLKSYYGVL